MESELNVRSLETCADPLQYATLRAQPDWQVGVGTLGAGRGQALMCVRHGGVAWCGRLLLCLPEGNV